MPRLQRDLRFAPTGFVGYWILKKDAAHFIQHRVSKIEYLVLYGSNVNAIDIFISDSGLSWLSLFKKQIDSFDKVIPVDYRNPIWT
jgi:hypothetical protein